MNRLTRFVSLAAGAALMAAAIVASPGSLAAQQTTDDVVTDVGGYFLAIHEGTCDEPVAASSWDLGAAHLAGVHDDGDADTREMRGSRDAVPVLIVDETVDTDFDTVLDEGQYVIAAHESADAFGTIVACGALGGVVDDGRLVIGLAEVGGSGVMGVAVIDEDSTGILGLGDDQLNVKVYLLTTPLLPDAMNGMATPGATPDDTMVGDVDGTPAPVEGDGDDVTNGDDMIDDEATPEAEG